MLAEALLWRKLFLEWRGVTVVQRDSTILTVNGTSHGGGMTRAFRGMC